MIYKIAAGIYFIFVALGLFGVVSIPAWAIGALALVAGIALLAGQ